MAEKHGRHTRNFTAVYNMLKDLVRTCSALKSYRDRIFDLRNRATDEAERSRLRAKATKDLSDIIALIDPNYGLLDLVSLRSLVNRQNLQFLAATVEELPSQTEAIEQYRGTSSTEVQDWVQKILNEFKQF